MSVDNVDYDFKADEPNSQTDAEAEDGVGGGNMDVYSQDRITQLNRLYSGASYDGTNVDASSIPKGVTDLSAGGYDTAFENNEETQTQTDAGAEDGAGGGVMDIWQQGRVTLLKQLAAGTFTNNSSFPLPGGVVDVPSGGYETPFENNEELQGIAATGKALAADGTPLSGDAIIEDKNGNIVSSVSTSGQFTVSAPAPSGVKAGENKSLGGYNFEFSPTKAGISVYQENIGALYNAGVFQYGSIVGTITDYDGDPVSGAGVFAAGAAASTNSKGKYELAAPGGKTVDLSAVGTTVTKTPSGGQTITVDFQFSRIILKVVDPNLNPLQGTAVDIGNESYRTNDEGKVVVERAKVDSYNVVVGSEAEFNIDVISQGDLVEKTFGKDYAGYRITTVESGTGVPIVDTTVDFENEGVPSQTNGNGRASAIVDSGGEKSLQIGISDRRYSTKVLEVSTEDGKIREKKVELVRNQNAPTY